jgi:hypothetical protein
MRGVSVVGRCKFRTNVRCQHPWCGRCVVTGSDVAVSIRHVVLDTCYMPGGIPGLLVTVDGIMNRKSITPVTSTTLP